MGIHSDVKKRGEKHPIRQLHSQVCNEIKFYRKTLRAIFSPRQLRLCRIHMETFGDIDESPNHDWLEWVSPSITPYTRYGTRYATPYLYPVPRYLWLEFRE